MLDPHAPPPFAADTPRSPSELPLSGPLRSRHATLVKAMILGLGILAGSLISPTVTPVAQADVVHLTDGGRLRGSVERTGDQIRIVMRGGTITVPASRVARIEKTDDTDPVALKDAVGEALEGADAAQCLKLAAAAQAANLHVEEGALLRRAAQALPRDLTVAAQLQEWREQREVLEPREGAETELRKAVGRTARILRTQHWIVAYDVDERSARARARMLEQAWGKFHDMAKAMGLTPRPIPHALEALQFSSHDTWVKSLPMKSEDAKGLSGLFVHATGRIHLYRTATSPAIRDAEKRAEEARKSVVDFKRRLAEQRKRMESIEQLAAQRKLDREEKAAQEERLATARKGIEAAQERVEEREAELATFERSVRAYVQREDLSTTTHEACHQLSFATGLCHPGQSVWLLEGLATLFEIESDRSFVLEAPNAPRLRDLRIGIELGVEPRLLPIVTDALFAPKASSKSIAYAHSWSLAYFLYRTRPEAFARYVRSSAAVGRGEAAAAKRLKEFAAYFGDDLESLEAEWLAFLARL